MIRVTLFLAIAVGFVLTFSSCKKITQDQLINGLWQVEKVKVSLDTVENYLTTLPQYREDDDCCSYKLDFEKDNTVIAYYIANGSFNRILAGNWQVTAYNEIYMQVDSFIDGVFKITQPAIKRRVLTGERNHIKAYDGSPLDTVMTVIEMRKI